MTFTVIWLDQKIAKLFILSDDKMERRQVSVGQPLHHTHALDHIDQMKHEEQLFAGILPHLSGTSRILILGPGETKRRFHHYLTGHHQQIAQNVVGCETVDHPTDAQIADYAKRFIREKLAI